jgi:hypothetical protein
MNIQEHFEIISLISGFIWLVILVLITGLLHSRNKENKLYTDFSFHIYFKLFAAVGYGIVYMLLFEGGGDTLAYWDGAINLNNLFWDSPFDFITELFSKPELSSIGERFNSTTGYPPGWIYREPESFFVSKVFVIFTFITFKSYWATSLILGFITALTTWKFYLAFEKLKLNHPNWLKFGILYMPSVAFWCSGISKDTMGFAALMLLMAQLLNNYHDKKSSSYKELLITLLSVFLIFQIRSYILVAMVPALLIGYSAILSRKNKENKLKKWTLKISFYALGAIFLFVFIRFSKGGTSIDNLLNEILVIQQDFANNETYGTNRYDLNITDYSASGIIRSIPMAIIAAFYRPFLWESFSPTMILNGLEGTLLFILTIQFFIKNYRKKLQMINNNEILTFSLIFILIMGFSVGFTSGLFGVLVRLKCIILPFLVILLSLKIPDTKLKIQD